MEDNTLQSKDNSCPEKKKSSDSYTYAYASYPENDRFDFDGHGDGKKYKIPTDRPVRIYCDGVYDLFHFGHSRQFLQAKHLFPSVHLIVGIHGDAETRKNKGTTVLKENERYEGVKHCKHVDEIIEDAPWMITEEFLEKHGIDYVSHDDLPYQYEGAASGDLYDHLKEIGKFIPTYRTKDISTTMLITRVLQESRVYLERQLKRGVTLSELNMESQFHEDAERNMNNTAHL